MKENNMKTMITFSLLALFLIVAQSSADTNEYRPDKPQVSAQQAEQAKTRILDVGGGDPMLAPVFTYDPQKASVLLSGGDLRNTVLDLSKLAIKALGIAEVRSKETTATVSLMSFVNRVFIDETWTVFPDNSRTVDSDGPFALFSLTCRSEGSPVENATIELRDSKRKVIACTKSNSHGVASLKLKNLKERIFHMTATHPITAKKVDQILLVPIVSAKEKQLGLIYYDGYSIAF
jgi:hypothetical protein